MPRRKRISLSLLACGMLSIPVTQSNAGPRFAQGDVTFSGTAQVIFTDRVSPNRLSQSDTVYAFIPTIGYGRDTGRLELDASLSFPMRRYERAERLNSNSVVFSIDGNVPFGTGPRLSGQWSANYSQGIQADYLTNQNLDSKRLDLRLSFDYRLRNRLSLRAGTGYNERESNGVLLNYYNSNRTTYYYTGIHMREIIGTVGAYVDYRVQYRDTLSGSINQDVDNRDGSIVFGVTGQLLPERLFPKLDADLSFGFQKSRRVGDESNGSTTRLTLDGSLRYPATTKADVEFRVTRNLRVTDDDRTVEQTDLSLGINYRIRQRWTADAQAGLGYNDFIFDGDDSRSDEVFFANISTSYSIRPFWNASVSYHYRDSSSNKFLSDYSSSRVTISTTISY